jgi:hypothetical protein
MVAFDKQNFNECSGQKGPENKKKKNGVLVKTREQRQECRIEVIHQLQCQHYTVVPPYLATSAKSRPFQLREESKLSPLEKRE